ncbi:MAG: TRL-like family protein [Leptospira sp.]|nr:TRL-like family protein [Leptospira sp.]
MPNLIEFSRIILYFLFTICFFSCASSGFGPQGYLYEEQRISLMETGLSAKKEGVACAKSYLGLLAFGDASIGESIRNGNIKEITAIELESFGFFGIFAKLCVVTKGN